MKILWFSTDCKSRQSDPTANGLATVVPWHLDYTDRTFGDTSRSNRQVMFEKPTLTRSISRNLAKAAETFFPARSRRRLKKAVADAKVSKEKESAQTCPRLARSGTGKVRCSQHPYVEER